MDDTQEWHEDPIPGMGAATQDSSTDESDTESDSEYTKPRKCREYRFCINFFV